MPVYPVSVNVLDPTIGEQRCNFPWVTRTSPERLATPRVSETLGETKKTTEKHTEINHKKDMKHRIAERILTAWWLATGFSIYFF